MMFNFQLLVLTVGLANQAAAFDYPRNFKEQQYVENLFKEIPVESDSTETLTKLRGELRAQLDLANHERNHQTDKPNHSDDGGMIKAEGERNANLLNVYLDVSNLTLAKCNLEAISDAAMLVELHNHDSETTPALAKYLKHSIAEQVLLCRPTWERNFATDLAETKGIALKTAIGFLGSIVSFYAYDDEEGTTVTRPWPWRYMRRAIEEIPEIPILAFMKVMGFLQEGQVDDGLFDECYPRHVFRQEYEDSVMKMCRPLNENIARDLELYQYIFSRLTSFDERLMETNFFTTKEDEYLDLFAEGSLLEWYSVGSICKKIVRSADNKDKAGGKDVLRDKVLHQLTYEAGLKKLGPVVKDFFKSIFG